MIYGFLLGLLSWAYYMNIKEKRLQQQAKRSLGKIVYHPMTIITGCIIVVVPASLVGALIENLL